MSNIHTNKIERLSEAELRQLKRIYETDQSLQGSIMLRGINAELESRSELIRVDGSPVLNHRRHF